MFVLRLSTYLTFRRNLAGFKLYYDIGTPTNLISKYALAKYTLWNLAPDEAKHHLGSTPIVSPPP